ncbi:MAG: carboxypeptidase-like regulatory domain-containing protein [Planctomycetes bacterium]|nr:carboxypeptidase-like regulatory domain-containing protein [Planctomycetota bacterium]
MTVRTRRGARPVRGAEVVATPAKDPPGRAREFQFSIHKTDAAGTIRLGPVPREAYRFSCRAEEFAPARSTDVSPAPDQPEVSITVELDEECRLRGIAVDEEGNPLAGTRALVRGGASYLGEGGRGDDKGSFEISGLPAGVDLEFSTNAFRYPGPDLPRMEYRSDPVQIRFSTPGEARDLGRVVLRRK